MAFSGDGEYASAPAPFPIVVNGTVMAGGLERVAQNDPVLFQNKWVGTLSGTLNSRLRLRVRGAT